jgi:dsRNA-specific ribonuclease
MDNLAVLGDCFLNLVTSISLYHRYPLDDTGVLTKKKINQILNNNLYRISVEKGLKHYLNSIQTCFSGKNANWIPPGFMTDEGNAERYTKQKAKQKPFADMIEALIGTFLISTNYLTTIKFMNWSGLDVIPTDEHGKNRILFEFYS